MDRPAVHIQQNIVSVVFVLVYHVFFPLYRNIISCTKKAATKSLLSCQARPVLFIVLAALVSYRTGSLACRLAGSLALAAAALLHGVLQGLRI